jgi:mono/diheme cytochrome c family protein
MRQAHRGIRWIGLLVGLVLSLGVAALSATAQDPGAFVGNRSSKVYHQPDCSAVKRTSARNKVELAGLTDVEAGEYKPCKICKPDRSADAPAPGDTSVFAAATQDDPQADGKLKFSRDIAPILAGNCMGCHGGDEPKGEFNLSTFRGLMKGGMSGPVIEPGKPQESLLVELVESRKMPRGGGNRRLADESIEKIHQWVAEGALLDAGISPTATLDKVAPSPEQRRAAELAKLSPEERDARLQAVARERWKQASATTNPAMTPGKNFLVFSELPEDRAEELIKTLEGQRARLGSLLGNEAATALTGPEKISVYVFNDPMAYVEFARSVEQRELEEGVQAHGRLGIEAPYLAAVDPLAGGDEPKVAARKPARSKKDDEPTGPERSLGGLLSQQLGAAAAQAGGKPPRWLAEGLGLYLASQVEPRSPLFNKLRRTAAEQYQLGWEAKATEALGDDAAGETLQALGFSLIEWLASSFRQQFPFFVRGMLQGPEKLDDVIKTCFGPQVARDQFLAVWGRFVVERYGPLMRGR